MQSPYSVTKSSILENKISLKDNEEGNKSEYERIVTIHRSLKKSLGQHVLISFCLI
jgi:hypothetical protein